MEGIKLSIGQHLARTLDSNRAYVVPEGGDGKAVLDRRGTLENIEESQAHTSEVTRDALKVLGWGLGVVGVGAQLPYFDTRLVESPTGATTGAVEPGYGSRLGAATVWIGGVVEGLSILALALCGVVALKNAGLRHHHDRALKKEQGKLILDDDALTH
jgi:hypothetical protein